MMVLWFVGIEGEEEGEGVSTGTERNDRRVIQPLPDLNLLTPTHNGLLGLLVAEAPLVVRAALVVPLRPVEGAPAQPLQRRRRVPDKTNRKRVFGFNKFVVWTYINPCEAAAPKSRGIYIYIKSLRTHLNVSWEGGACSPSSFPSPPPAPSPPSALFADAGGLW